MKRIWTYLLSGVLAMTVAVPAMAMGGHRDRSERRESRRDDRHETHYREYRRAKWNDHDRDDRRKGWDRGKKTGWHGDNLPPGQAIKHNDHDRDDWARERRRHRRHHRVNYARNDRRPVVTPVSRPAYPTQHPMGHPTAHPTMASNGATTIAQKPSGHVMATR